MKTSFLVIFYFTLSGYLIAQQPSADPGNQIINAKIDIYFSYLGQSLPQNYEHFEYDLYWHGYIPGTGEEAILFRVKAEKIFHTVILCSFDYEIDFLNWFFNYINVAENRGFIEIANNIEPDEAGNYPYLHMIHMHKETGEIIELTQMDDTMGRIIFTRFDELNK